MEEKVFIGEISGSGVEIGIGEIEIGGGEDVGEFPGELGTEGFGVPLGVFVLETLGEGSNGPIPGVVP